MTPKPATKIKNFFQPDYKLRLTLAVIGLFILLFAAARLALLLCYPSRFEDIDLWVKISSFFSGLRFDLSITAVFLAAPLFFLNIPVKNKYYNAFWLALTGFLFFAFAVYSYADLLYFPEVNRHISDELLHLNNDWGFLINYVLQVRNFVFLLIAASVSALIVVLVLKYYKRHSSFKRPLWKDIVKLLLIAGFAVLFIRGKIDGKAIGIADIYDYAKTPAQASLVGNAPFIAFHILRKGSASLDKNNFPAEKAVENVKALLFKSGEESFDPAYPLMRRPASAPNPQKINFVIVLFEGWIPAYIDAMSGAKTGATPVFDDIIKNGVLFTNAYSVGARSILGFAGAFASVPLIPDLPVFGYGLELTEFSPLFEAFKKAGYYTFYAQTSLRHSFRMCSLASYLGAEETFGWEDMPMLLDYLEEPFYGYDYEAYMLAADKIKKRGKNNFLAAVFTGTTHEPFAKTQERFYKFTSGSWDDEYRNTLYYADWALGEFLNKAKEDGWFDDTVFVFVSDHSLKEKRDSLYEKFNIPLVFYAPKLLKPARIDYVASQLDIAPTLYALAGLNYPYTAFGRDLFDASHPEKRAAFVSEGINIGLITKDGAIRHNRGKILSAEAKNDKFDKAKAEETLLSLDKAALTLISSNKWFKNGK